MSIKNSICGLAFIVSNLALPSCRVGGYHHGVTARYNLPDPKTNFAPVIFYEQGKAYEALQEEPYLLTPNTGLANHTLTLPNGNRPALQPGQGFKVDIINNENKAYYQELLAKYNQNHNLVGMKFSQDVVVNGILKSSPCGVEQLRATWQNPRNLLRPQTSNVLTGAMYVGLLKSGARDFGLPNIQNAQAVCEIIDQQPQGYTYRAPELPKTVLTEKDMLHLMFGVNVRSQQNSQGVVQFNNNTQRVTSGPHAIIIIPEQPKKSTAFRRPGF